MRGAEGGGGGGGVDRERTAHMLALETSVSIAKRRGGNNVNTYIHTHEICSFPSTMTRRLATVDDHRAPEFK